MWYNFEFLGMWDRPFTLKELYAPVLSGPWRRPCRLCSLIFVHFRVFVPQFSLVFDSRSLFFSQTS